MSERKTIKVYDGFKEFTQTPEEFVDYISSLPVEARKNVKVLSGNIDSIYENQSGVLVQEGLTGAQIINRINVGEQPVVTGAQDPKLDAKRRQDAGRIDKQITDDENVLALWNQFNPLGLTGAPQRLGEAALGEEEYRRTQAKIAEGNPSFSVIGGIGQGLLVGGFAGGVLKGATGISKLRGIGALAVDEVSIEYAFYTKDIQDNNEPFVAEDLGRNILKGAIFAAPFYLGTAARGLVRGAGLTAAGAAPTVQKALIAGAVVSAPGTAKAAKFARSGAAVGLAGKVYNKIFGKVAGSADEVAEAQVRLAKQAEEIGKFTPEILRRQTPSQIKVLLNNIDEFLEDARITRQINKIDYKTLHDKVTKVRSSVIAARNQALSMNQKLGGLRFKKKPAKWTKEGRALWSQEADAMFYKIEQAGFDDIAGHLKKTLNTKQPYAVYGKWAQVRLDAALKGRSVGGATEVDNMLRNFLEDDALWGKPVADRGRNINIAIDNIRDAYNQLGDLNIPKDLSEIVAKDATRLTEINKNIDKLRAGYKVLRDEGLLSEMQVRGVERTFTQANEAVKNGTRAYMDTSVVNKARKQAATQHEKMRAAVNKTPEQMRAEATENVSRTTKRIFDFAENGFKALDGTLLSVSRAGQAGVIGFNTLDEEERTALYEQVTSVLPVLVGAPEAMEEAIGDYLGSSYQGAPQTTMMAGVSSTQSMFWLNAQLPRTDRSLYGRQLPTPKAKRDVFLEKFVATADPMSVPEAALTGRITEGMVEALRVTNPALYAEVGIVVSEMLDQVDLVKAPRQVLNGLNQLIGGIDPLYTGPALLELQSNYAQSQGQQQVIQGGQSMPDGSNPQKPGNQFTFTQRLTSY